MKRFQACIALSLSVFLSLPVYAAENTDAPLPEVFVIHDFETGEMINNLGGPSGSWNLDPTDINNSWCDEDIVEMPGPDGKIARVLKLNYSVDSALPSQNGFWTKLQDLDAREYDHLDIVLKGDVDSGFTEIFKLELKKCKEPPCKGDPVTDEVIKGSFRIPVTSEWQTFSVPLNKITGIIDFANPESWKDASVARMDLDELVVVFHDRMVTAKTGTIYIDEIRLRRTGNPGPTAIDFPPRKIEKTGDVRLEGLDFARFLVKRLGGFPEKTVVKKDFPQDDKAFIMEIAKDTWRFFDEIVDKEHGLPLDTIQLGSKDIALDDGSWIGDYTNVTNIGVYLMVLVSAFDLGFLTREEAVARIQTTLTTMESLEHHESGFPYNYYDTTTAERTSYFVSLVDSAWLVAGYYVVKNAFPEELTAQADRLLARGSLAFFYDPVERQFFHGFYQHLDVYSDYHYGAFYTEPRVASYMGIARGEVPEEHWFVGLIRTFPDNFAWQNQKPKNRVKKKTLGYEYESGWYEWKDLVYMPSWGGSAFEALMPTLVLKEKELAPEGLGLNDARHVQGQIRYATEELGQPVWGMSPSSVPEGGYSEYGAKPFGSKGYKGKIVTPHATVLALEFDADAAIKNLRKMLEMYDVYGEYGFYDAVNSETGLVARKYLSLDQGMIFVAINNYINNGAIRNRFHADPVMQKAERVLTEEKFFEPAADARKPADA